MSEYLGNRIVPRHDGVWQSDKAYEPLTIVLEDGTGDSYISRRPVPAGTALSQKDYWAMCSRFSEQVKLFRDGVNADVAQMHSDLNATEAAINQKADDTIKAINQTAAQTISTVNQKTDDTLAAMTERTEAAEKLTSDNKSSLENRMKQIETRQDANVAASTDKNADYAAELVDARVDDNGHTFDSAGGNLRALGRVRSLKNIAKTWPWLDNRIVNESGQLIYMSTWSCLHMIPVTGDHLVIAGKLHFMSGNEEYNNITCFDRDRKYLGGCFRSLSGQDYYDYLDVPLLEGTAFVSVTTGTKAKGDIAVYLPEDGRVNNLLDTVASTWQWMNGEAAIAFTQTGVDVAFKRDCYLCRFVNGNVYKQNKVTPADSVSVEFSRKGWWVIYFNVEEVLPEDSVEDTTEESGATGDGGTTGDNSETKEAAATAEVITSEGRIHVESNDRWEQLFTPDHFVIAAFYDGAPLWTTPTYYPLDINGIKYGNPSRALNDLQNYTVDLKAYAQGLEKYLGHTMNLEYGALEIDTVNKTLQVKEKILATTDLVPYYWLDAAEEPTPFLETEELELNHLVILAYDRKTKTLNFYDTKTFQALGPNGYYIAAWYQRQFWYPHMNPSMTIILDGVEYKAGQLFVSETRNSYIEKRYLEKFDADMQVCQKQDTHTIYFAYGAIVIDNEAGTIRVSKKILGVPDNLDFRWIYTSEEATPIAFNTPNETHGMQMRILGYDRKTGTVNLYNTSMFQALGTDGYYVAAWYGGKLYNARIHPQFEFVIDGKTYLAGDLFDTASSTYVEKRYKDYVTSALTVNLDGDDMGDIVTPSHWDCMEGRQFSMFFDCLSRHEGRENLYRVTNSKSLTRNEYCLNYTPKDTDTDFNVTVIRLDGDTMLEQERKTVQVRVHHPLGQTLRKNVCICGDSLVDCNQVATEVYRMLEEDGDCEINQIGTRGPSNGRHEGRGSWKWKDYLGNTSLAGKTNAFWDTETNRLDFQKYCATYGFEGIDYFLIALGTNDVSQGSTLYRTEADVQKFVDYAKEFVDKLLDPEVGYPNCKVGIGLCGPGSDYSYLAGNSMGIFRKSINTLNLALIKAFDEGKYKANVTCFAHGLRTNRRLAYPYSDKPVTDRFEETSRTLTNSIHPSARGYQAWADGYYCQIRAWLEEDAAK